jgi:serine/threonine protein kinase
MSRGALLGDRFELEERVGAGGMGEVYRALDRSSGERVAVKVLLDRNALGDRRFMKEAEVIASLSHPAIIRYVAHGIAGSGEPYLAMEWLEGEDLGERLRRGALTVDEAVTLAARVVGALAAVHARSIVHRDSPARARSSSWRPPGWANRASCTSSCAASASAASP